jgi:hypothetical protein
MTQLIQGSRWLLFLPVGIAVGLLVASVALNMFAVVIGGWWLTAWLGLLIGAVLQPVVGYHVGHWIAPAPGKVSRFLLKTPYAVLGGSAAMMLGKMLLGGDPSCGLGVMFTGLSDWWCTLWYCLGMVYGCGRVLDLPPPAPSSAHRGPGLFVPSPFRWDAAN